MPNRARLPAAPPRATPCPVRKLTTICSWLQVCDMLGLGTEGIAKTALDRRARDGYAGFDADAEKPSRVLQALPLLLEKLSVKLAGAINADSEELWDAVKTRIIAQHKPHLVVGALTAASRREVVASSRLVSVLLDSLAAMREREAPPPEFAQLLSPFTAEFSLRVFNERFSLQLGDQPVQRCVWARRPTLDPAPRVPSPLAPRSAVRLHRPPTRLRPTRQARAITHRALWGAGQTAAPGGTHVRERFTLAHMQARSSSRGRPREQLPSSGRRPPEHLPSLWQECTADIKKHMVMQPYGERVLRPESGESQSVARGLLKEEPEALFRKFTAAGGKAHE